MLIPSFSHFFDMLRIFSYTCLPTGKLAYLLMEVCFAILKIDQQQMQRLGVYVTKSFAHLRALYQSSLLILRIFYRHDEYRDNCDHQFIDAFHQLSTIKNPWRPYGIEGCGEQSYVTAVTFAMVTCIQSLGNAAEVDVSGAYYKAIKSLAADLLQVGDMYVIQCVIVFVHEFVLFPCLFLCLRYVEMLS